MMRVGMTVMAITRIIKVSLLLLTLLLALFGVTTCIVTPQFCLDFLSPLAIASDVVCELLVVLPLVLHSTTH